MKRKEAIQRISDAYDQKRLQMFRKGISRSDVPSYYDPEHKDCCGVGAILTDKHIKNLKNSWGGVECIYNESHKYLVGSAMHEMKKSTFHGIKKGELEELQKYHDKAFNARVSADRESNLTSFKIALDGLKASVGIAL